MWRASVRVTVSTEVGMRSPESYEMNTTGSDMRRM
jgi:hypothetical protein